MLNMNDISLQYSTWPTSIELNNILVCPDWSEWGDCSVPCGSGTKTRTRGDVKNCTFLSESIKCDTGTTCQGLYETFHDNVIHQLHVKSCMKHFMVM